MFQAPPISKDLIEYLEKVFPAPFLAARPDASPHFLAALVHAENGRQYVIAHLKRVYEEQQNEDPLNVHEST
jgi:hypothetical protein